MSDYREPHLDDVAEEVVSFAHGKIWGGPFTAAESRLLWLTVIKKLLESTWIDAKSNVVAEHLKLKP